MPHTGNKRKRAGKNLTSEEAFAKSWGAGRDADVYLLTGLFDQRTGLLPEGSFPRDVFGPSLRCSIEKSRLYLTRWKNSAACDEDRCCFICVCAYIFVRPDYSTRWWCDGLVTSIMREDDG